MRRRLFQFFGQAYDVLADLGPRVFILVLILLTLAMMYVHWKLLPQVRREHPTAAGARAR